MSTYQKNIFNKLITDKNYSLEYSLNDLVFDFDSQVIETLLNIELDVYLEYCSKYNIDNKRNGSTQNINLRTSTRDIHFNRPRLRNEKDFDSILIPKRTRILDDLHNNIILLYAKNNSINDNKALVSHKIPVYVAVGTKLNGHKEIVGLYLGNEDEYKNTIDSLYNKNIGESKTFWTEIFEDLKDRGVKKLLFLVSDGVSGIAEASKEAFPGVFHQICVVHLVRNLKKYATKTYSKEVIGDFKKVYTSSNKE